MAGLVYRNEVPKAPDDSVLADNTLIYILGGTQKSYHQKFRKAAALYHLGLSKNIMVLNDTGLTEYDPLLHRNLTGNEWNARELGRHNVRKEDIEFVSVPMGIFGTYSEARAISRIALSRGCRRLILVTSDYHTRRVWISFSKFLKDTPVELYVYGTYDNAVCPMLLEYFKLAIYKILCAVQ